MILVNLRIRSLDDRLAIKIETKNVRKKNMAKNL